MVAQYAMLAYASADLSSSPRHLILLAVVLAASLGLATDADAASSVGMSNDGFTWSLATLGDGAGSVVNISRAGNTVTVEDTTGATASTGCAQADPNTATCTITSSDETGLIETQLGGGNDSIALAPGMEYAAATLDGGEGNDTLTGAGGRDEIRPGNGAGQVLTGGGGSDTVSYSGATGPVTANLDGVANDGSGAHTDQIAADVENLGGTPAADTLTGDGGPNTLRGGGGGDNVTGAGGDDFIVDGPGTGVLNAGEGNDELDIGSPSGPDNDQVTTGGGIDTISYASATAPVTAGLSPLTPYGRPGEIDAYGDSPENLIGGRAADQLSDNSADNTVVSDEKVIDGQAAAAADTVNCSGGGTDTIIPGSGDGPFTGCDVAGPGSAAYDVSDAMITEGHAGTTNLTFTITRSNAFGNLRTEVSYETHAGSATPGADYTPRAGVARFAGNATSVQVTVPVSGDGTDESDETVQLRLTDPFRSTINDGTATGTIADDDDPPPTFSISDATLTEGNSGQANMSFTVTRSGTAGSTTSGFHYATSDGSATAGSDYTASSDDGSIAGSNTQTTITVPVNGDTTPEGDETFTVTLSAPTNATIADGTAQGTITNDDQPPPTVSIADSSVTEGNLGQAGMLFTITRSSTAGGATTTVNWASGDGTATAGGDYQASSGTATISGSATQTQVTVPVNGDTADESDESLIVSLSSPTNGTLGDGTAIGTIFDDDGGTASAPASGAPPAADATPPGVTLSSKKNQKAGPFIAVGAACSEACTAGATGKLYVPGAASAAKTFTIKAKAVSIAAGGRRTLKLKLSRKVLAAVKKALRKRRKVSAKITVTAKDAAGNAARKTLRIKLKR
jgi:hypothetical protein